jgi:hypothetical protein
MAPQYNWISFVQARQQLALRLADTGNVYWTDTENGLYLVEALRTWNSLVNIWNAEMAFQAPISPGQIWYMVSLLPTSPRARTVTDSYLYTVMEYHLLEPPTGGTWTGTSQFTIAALSGALQRRRDEIIQLTSCNLFNSSAVASAGSVRTYLPDNVLEVRRTRFVPQTGLGLNPVTLWREDAMSFEYFEPGYLQAKQQMPKAYDVIAGPPLSLDIDLPPPVNGTFDMVLSQSGATFNPPAPTLVGIPDDFTWVAKWGALSDVLGMESEATDRLRAAYCLERYRDGLKWMMQAPWITLAEINGVVCGTPSFPEMDSFSPEWDSNPSAFPSIVTAGIDLIAVCPVPTTTVGVGLTLIGNAPIPVEDNDPVQISRDSFDVILDYAQHLASFKMGGAEFVDTKELAKNFFQRAMSENVRLKACGLFRDVLLDEGHRSEVMQPRFEETNAR